jgi:hypothetical protein
MAGQLSNPLDVPLSSGQPSVCEERADGPYLSEPTKNQNPRARLPRLLEPDGRRAFGCDASRLNGR